jgi:hypothetical protein
MYLPVAENYAALEELSDFDPFLLLDEMAPTQVGPREAKGAPERFCS